MLHEHNYNLFLCNTREDGEEERRYIKALLDKFVDGSSCAGGFEENLDLFQVISVVAIDRRSNLKGQLCCANYEGGYLARSTLLNGCSRILMVDQKQVASMDQGQAIDCLKDYNIPYDEDLRPFL